jgi:hypothetical protein
MRPPNVFPEMAGDFAIGLRPIAPEGWFEGGEAAPAVRKDALLAAHPELVWGELAGSREGQVEVAELVAAATGCDLAAGPPPLYAAARAVSDDLCLMQPVDGAWTLTAISLSAGTYFTAREALGKTTAELHGPVPGFGGRLLPRVERIFDNLPADSVLERRNWTVANTADTFAPDAAAVRAELPRITAETAGERLFVRSERQTIRRLPRTGGVVFTIRVWSRSLGEIAEHPADFERLRAAWRAATEDFAAYKRFDLYRDLVEGFLRVRGE